MPTLYTQSEIKSVEKREGEDDVYEVIVSSGKVDRLGDTIDPKGWYLKNYIKNPVILWSHASGGWGTVAIPPVGRAIKTWNDEDNNDLRQKQVFASTPFAQELKTLVDEKCLHAQSVGFMPLAEDEKGNIEIEGKMYRRVFDEELKQYVEKGFVEIAGKKYSKEGQHFTKQELLEVSWVDVPALPSALVQAKKRNLSLVIKALEEMEKVEGEEETSEEDEEDKKEIDGYEKPYPNEHSCRLENPNKYEKFARKNCEAKKDGKCIDFIYGIDDESKSELQAMRFNKEVWEEADAKSYCEEKDGTFEPASKKKTFGERLEQVEIILSKLEKAIVPLKGDNPGEDISNGEPKGRKPFVKQKSKKSDVERLLIIFDKMCESLLRKLRQKDDKS